MKENPASGSAGAERGESMDLKPRLDHVQRAYKSGGDHACEIKQIPVVSRLAILPSNSRPTPSTDQPQLQLQRCRDGPWS